MLPPRSQLEILTDPGYFAWAVGIEDTFITEPWPKTGRTLDEYALTGHYDQWEADLKRMAALGVKCARYGIPWHRVQPAPDRFDWRWADGPLERLLELGISPMVDLIHYGLPRWLEGAWLNPDLPERMAEYAARLAERFRGRIFWYTPLNEPRITAWYCGRLGWWPPFARGWRGFVAVMQGVCRSIVRTCQALSAVDPEIVHAHVDATDLYSTEDPTLLMETAHRQELVFLALDLVSGRVGEGHALRPWLLRQGVTEAALDWFLEHAVALEVVGLNMYPMFTRKRLMRTAQGMRIRMPYGSDELVRDLVRRYHARYGCPVMITETAARGPVARRQAWLEASVKAVRELRQAGTPVVGYTWWPMFSLVAWAYRQGIRPESAYLEHMGLWDLAPGAEGELERRPTPLVDAYRALASGGAVAAGMLDPTASPAARMLNAVTPPADPVR